MKLRERLIEELIKAGVSSPRLEADIIIKNTAPSYPDITFEQKDKAIEFLNRRINHEPLDKIIGKRDFYKYCFAVNSDVLSPRPDTEVLVEKAINLVKENELKKIIDLGTGSGCIILSILKDVDNLLGVGVDISDKAIEVAKHNANELDLLDRVSFVNCDFDNIDTSLGEFDIIVSNPPYIPLEEFETLDIEVKKYDPKIALVGGSDGLVFYKQIAQRSPLILKKNGYILLEVGYNQAQDVANIFIDNGFTFVEFLKDLAGINRCVILKK